VFAVQRAAELVVVVAGLLLGVLMLITIGVSSGLLAG
jgi:hypothetical protein